MMRMMMMMLMMILSLICILMMMMMMMTTMTTMNMTMIQFRKNWIMVMLVHTNKPQLMARSTCDQVEALNCPS